MKVNCSFRCSDSGSLRVEAGFLRQAQLSLISFYKGFWLVWSFVLVHAVIYDCNCFILFFPTTVVTMTVEMKWVILEATTGDVLSRTIHAKFQHLNKSQTIVSLYFYDRKVFSQPTHPRPRVKKTSFHIHHPAEIWKRQNDWQMCPWRRNSFISFKSWAWAAMRLDKVWS